MKNSREKNKSLFNKYPLLGIFLVILLGSCQPTGFVKSYVDKEFANTPMKKILVIASARKGDIRKLFESKCARHLISRGVEAVPSYKLIPDLADLTREVVAQKIQSRGFDGVLVALPVAKGQSESFNPKDDQNRDTLFDYYASVHHKTTKTGYLLEFQWMELDLKLFETASGLLVWSGITREFDINSQQISNLIDQLSAAISVKLAKDGLIE